MHRAAIVLAVIAALCLPVCAQEPDVELSPDWEYVADTVMGGVSRGQARRETVAGRAAIRLTGDVSLANNGGFVQIAFDLNGGAAYDPSPYSGITFDVFGNGTTYEMRLRTDQLTRPWQSFRADFTAPPRWTTLRIPFADFEAHRTGAAFDPKGLRRIGVLAIGREMQADIAVSAIGFYREQP